MTKKFLRGFTLIEILVTIVILSILAGITIVALNPGQNIDDANDLRRKSDVVTIMNAISQYSVDNGGTFPGDVTATDQAISNTAANICSVLVPTYLAELPVDPLTGSYSDCLSYSTGYLVKKDATDKRITVTATMSDGTAYAKSR